MITVDPTVFFKGALYQAYRETGT